MKKVAVVGAGAIGSVFGVRLCASKEHDVTLCVRTPIERLRVETSSGAIEAPARCLTDPADAEPADWILLAVKANQTEGTAPWLKALTGPGTVIAVLQNGVEHIERVSPHANGARILPVVVQCPADRLSPGRVVQNAGAALIPPDDEGGRGLRELFGGTDIRVEPTSDFVTAKWRKLCSNIGAGPVTALTGRGRGVIRRPDVAELCRALVRECAAVGRAEGAKLPEDIPEKVVEAMQGFPLEATTSMMADRVAGRPLEADAMTGAVVRIGERHGIETPFNRAINALLLAT